MEAWGEEFVKMETWGEEFGKKWEDRTEELEKSIESGVTADIEILELMRRSPTLYLLAEEKVK